jgi:hypothetical protein
MSELHSEVLRGPFVSAQSAPRGALARGLIAGTLAGVVMAVFLAGAASLAGLPPLQPLRAIGATLGGPEALAGGSGPALVGAVLHLLLSAALGVAIAALIPSGLSPFGGSVVGAGYALFVLGFMASLVVPTVNPAFAAAAQPIGGAWVVAHVVFGATLGLALVVRFRGDAPRPRDKPGPA